VQHYGDLELTFSAEAAYLHLLHGSAGLFFDPTWPLNAPTSKTRLQLLNNIAQAAYFPSTMLLGCVAMTHALLQN